MDRTLARLALALTIALSLACGAKSAPPAAPGPSNAGTQAGEGDLPPPAPGPSGEMYEAHPGLSVPVEWVACDNTQCMALETSCADYCSGGALVGVTVDHAEELRPHVARIKCERAARKDPCPPVDQIEVACMTGVCIPVTPDISGDWKD